MFKANIEDHIAMVYTCFILCSAFSSSYRTYYPRVITVILMGIVLLTSHQNLHHYLENEKES